MRRHIARIEAWVDAANARPKLCLSILALLLAIQVSPWFYPTGDGSLYVSTVREFLASDDLSEFRCFVPPGYVVMILPTFLVNDRPFLELSIMNWFLGVALLLGVYVWSRRQFPSVAILLTAIVMVNISVWTYYRRPLKETAFMAVLVWTVNLLHAFLGTEKSRGLMWRGIAASLLLTFLSLIRYPGITVAIGFGVAMFLQAYRGRIAWMRAGTLTVAITFLPITVLCSWLVYDKYYVGGAVYWHEIMSVYTDDIDGTSTAARAMAKSEIGSASTRVPFFDWLPGRDSHFMTAALPRFLNGLQFRITDVGCMSLPGLWKAVPEPGNWLDLWTIVYSVFFALLFVGWFRLARRKTDVLLMTFPAYFLLYVHWVCDQPGGRFMLPMLPAVVACAWYGLGPHRCLRVAVFALFLFLHFGQASAYWLIIDAPRAARAHRNWPAIDRLTKSIDCDPKPVGMHDIPLEIQLALRITLSKESPLQTVTETVDPSIHWIVSREDAPHVSGFAVRESAGGYSLLERQAGSPNPVMATRPPATPVGRTTAAASRSGINNQSLLPLPIQKSLGLETLQ